VKLSRTGLELIKKFEGLRLTAYICPAGVWTIGYGHTGPDVYSGLKISEDRAEQLLWQDIESFEQCINSFVTVKLNQNEYDALVSFTYNIGTTAFINSTLLRLLNEGTDRKVVAEEFKRWVKGGDGQAIPGLVRRREEEKRLFLAKVKHPLLSKSILAKQDTWLKKRMADSTLLAPEEKLFVPKGSAWEWSELTMYAGQRHQAVKLLADQKTWFIWPDHWKIINDVPDDAHTYTKSNEIKLEVPYYSQRDNYRDADRTCFSSTCAMLVSALKPGAIKGDDDYVKTVFSIGDTTESWTQLAALERYGIEAEFRQNCNWSDVEELLNVGCPVPLGILHHGPVSAPTGGGHWVLCVGISADGERLWIHDPWGELDVVGGGYPKTYGKYVQYSKKNLGPRWMVEGAGTGWALFATKW